MTKKRDIDAYATTYSADYGFEAEMVHYRRKLVLDRLALHKPKTVIEVGCGPDLTVEAWAKAGGTWESWIIVEPAPAFAQTARARIAAAGLTITPERKAIVDFTKPITKEISEVLVTGPSAPEIKSIEDLSGETIYVRASSSYRASHQNPQRRGARRNRGLRVRGACVH